MTCCHATVCQALSNNHQTSRVLAWAQCGTCPLQSKADLSQPNHDPCPAHAGHWFNKSTGDCSCGGNHSAEWRSNDGSIL